MRPSPLLPITAFGLLSLLGAPQAVAQLQPPAELTTPLDRSNLRCPAAVSELTKSLKTVRPTGHSGFIWPTRGIFSSGYGWDQGVLHKGIDISNKVGTPIVAVGDSQVSYAGWSESKYGCLVEIQHADGSKSLYGNNRRLLVQAGQQVSQGTQIAEMGSTDRTRDPHLHFEIHPAGQGAVNPLQFLPGRSDSSAEEPISPVTGSLPSSSRDKLWVRIREDITIEALASQLRIQETPLAKINGVNEDHAFRRGDWVVIPSGKASTAKQLASLDTSELRRSAPRTEPPPLESTGVVRFGDNLVKLSQRYRLSIQDLLRLNPGLETARFVEGMQIRVSMPGASRSREELGLKPTGSGGLSWPDLPGFNRPSDQRNNSSQTQATPLLAPQAPPPRKLSPRLAGGLQPPAELTAPVEPAAPAAPQTLGVPSAPTPWAPTPRARGRSSRVNEVPQGRPRRFDQSLVELVRQGVVTPAERSRVQSSGALRPGELPALQKACRTGALTEQECREGVSVRWRGRHPLDEGPLDNGYRSLVPKAFSRPTQVRPLPNWQDFGNLRVDWASWKQSASGVRIAEARGAASQIAVDCSGLTLATYANGRWGRYRAAEGIMSQLVFKLCDNSLE